MKVLHKNFVQFILLAFILLGFCANADDKYPVPITPDLPYLDIDISGKTERIQRIQDTKHKLRNSYTKTSRSAPPFSIQPAVPVEGVTPAAELEVVNFLANKVEKHTGILIDARMPKWYSQGTIPGAINVPFTVVQSDAYKDIFEAFGVSNGNFAGAHEIMVFDNGPWCQQGSQFIKSIVKYGYPVSKISYYRGGIQFWQILGLTTIQATH